MASAAGAVQVNVNDVRRRAATTAAGLVAARGGTVSTANVREAVPVPAAPMALVVAVMLTAVPSGMLVASWALPLALIVAVPRAVAPAAKATVPEVAGAPPTVTVTASVPCQPAIAP